MKGWIYPLHFIDFETTMVAIPFHKGRRPYEQIAFQFSHHTVGKDGKITHQDEYINREKGHFPNFDFVRALMNALSKDNGTIFRYATHENTVLNQIRNQLLDSKEKIEDKDHLIRFIESITKSGDDSSQKWEGSRNMVDMCELVKKYFYHPLTKGSNSIKKVLPAILNESSYLQTKYSKPIYGSGAEIASLNYKNWSWIEKDLKGAVIDPYKRLPSVFSDLDLETMDSLITDGSIADGGAAMTAYWLIRLYVKREKLFFNLNTPPNVSSDYIFTRDSKFRKELRAFIQGMYEQFSASCPDTNFVKKAQVEYREMLWQMYLTWCFINFSTVPIAPPDTSQEGNPDIILQDGTVIEAVIAKRGADGVDRPFAWSDVPMKNGISSVQSLPYPDDRIILRITNSISEKVKQYERWLKAGTIKATQPFIIAVNASGIDEAADAYGGSYGTRSVFAIGEDVLVIPVNLETGGGNMDESRNEIKFKPEVIKKKTQAKVSSDLFLNAKHDFISAIIFSPFNLETMADRPSRDLELILNPFAKNPIKQPLLTICRETWLEWDDDKSHYFIRTKKIPHISDEET